MASDKERREVARRLRGVPVLALAGFDDDGNRKEWEMIPLRELAGAIGSIYDGANDTEGHLEVVSRLADLIEPDRGSGGRAILCAHCESASWCGCEPGDEESGCDFEPSVTEGEPPYNLYSLYEAVLRRRPRDECAIEDDEVEELVDALLDICNAPGHEHIQRPQPGEPQVKRELKYRARCDELGAEMKRQRDALLALADEMEFDGAGALDDEDWCKPLLVEYAHRIREALGVES